MAPLNLPWEFLGRPIKPVAFVLMLSMIVITAFAFADLGVLGASVYADFLGGLSLGVGGMFGIAWVIRSQSLSEWALIGAFFVWGIRFWVIILVQAGHGLVTEGWYLSFLWMLLAGGSWLLERSDPDAVVKIRGGKWTRQ